MENENQNNYQPSVDGYVNQTSCGIDANIAGLLSYLAGFITGIVFLVIEKENKFVRFHAMQSTILFSGLFIVNIVLGFIPILGWAIGLLISLASVILWIILMIKAFNKEMYKLPVVGDMAEKQLSSK